MKINKIETPRLWKRLVENEANFEKLVASEKKFNAEMLEKYGIRFGLVIVTDVIIVDDKCIDEFDDLIERLGILRLCSFITG